MNSEVREAMDARKKLRLAPPLTASMAATTRPLATREACPEARLLVPISLSQDVQ